MHLDLTSKTRGNPMCRVDLKGCNSKHPAEKQKKNTPPMKHALLMYDFFGERQDEDNTVCSGSQRNPCSHCFLNVCLLHHFFCPPCCLETRMNCLRVFSPLMLKVLFVDPLTQSFHTFIRREDNDLAGKASLPCQDALKACLQSH